jgi:hypothetical protein
VEKERHTSRPDAECPAATPRPDRIESLWSLDDIARRLKCSRRLVERLKSAGKLPPPDLRVGRMPRWKEETIRAWIERGGRP